MEDEEQEERETVQLRDDDDCPNGDSRDPVDHQTQQHDGDAGFDCHAGGDIERFAEPPELSYAYCVSQGSKKKIKRTMSNRKLCSCKNAIIDSYAP